MITDEPHGLGRHAVARAAFEQLRHLDDCLQQVHVDGERVERVSLRPGAHRRPLREVPLEQSREVHRLEDSNSAPAGPEDLHEGAQHRRRPLDTRRKVDRFEEVEGGGRERCAGGGLGEGPQHALR